MFDCFDYRDSTNQTYFENGNGQLIKVNWWVDWADNNGYVIEGNPIVIIHKAF
jgi:hypothetical protein